MLDTMTVTIPEGISGNVSIRRLTAGPQSLRDLIREPGRAIPEGYQFTTLYRAGKLWMSDTPAERQDHYPALLKAYQMGARRVLVNGLGLGMIVQGLLQIASVEHIDVVEIDLDVIALVADHYQTMAAGLDKTVQVHQGDAFTICWSAGVRWDLAWSDVWENATTDNLVEMERLQRRYASRVNWHGHWLRDMLVAQRREYQRLERRRAALVGY